MKPDPTPEEIERLKAEIKAEGIEWMRTHNPESERRKARRRARAAKKSSSRPLK